MATSKKSKKITDRQRYLDLKIQAGKDINLLSARIEKHQAVEEAIWKIINDNHDMKLQLPYGKENDLELAIMELYKQLRITQGTTAGVMLALSQLK